MEIGIVGGNKGDEPDILQTRLQLVLRVKMKNDSISEGCLANLRLVHYGAQTKPTNINRISSIVRRALKSSAMVRQFDYTHNKAEILERSPSKVDCLFEDNQLFDDDFICLSNLLTITFTFPTSFMRQNAENICVCV